MTPSAIRQLEAAGFTSTQADALDYAIDRRLHDDADRFAMKSDLAVLATKDELHGEMNASRNELWSHTRWIIGTVLLVGSVGIGLIGLLVKGG